MNSFAPADPPSPPPDYPPQDDPAEIVTFDADNIAKLVSEGTFWSSEHKDFVYLHKRRVQRYGDGEYKDIPLPPRPGPLKEKPRSFDDFVLIPKFMISTAALWSSGKHVGFAKMARAHILGAGKDAESDDDDDVWRATMTRCGINEGLQDVIMTPMCRIARRTRSCKFWLLDTVTARSKSLLQIREASHNRGWLNYKYGFDHEEEKDDRYFHGVPGMSPKTALDPEISAHRGDHTVLYQTGYETEFKSMFSDQGLITNLEPLMHPTRLSGDFHAANHAIYLHPHYQMAVTFAYFAKKRDPTQISVLLRIEIPNERLNELSFGTEQCIAYWPGTFWKSLVWNCRRCVKPKNELREAERATLVKGNICAVSDAVIAKLPTPAHMEQRMVLPALRGTNAVQYGFIGQQGVQFLCGFMCSVYPFTHASEKGVERACEKRDKRRRMQTQSEELEVIEEESEEE
ncbi:hypothetical protein B0T10DRAFT_547088 [Thelonectria olida]|uniref:Uncharacterized protein n=1 Tax=Thelonectria olida TaxID=1576542 RepID=A0A9P8W7Y0_9HYPO|nr:hypothetical protein B0T10DRAFT_547088 [Thelonectria olida]